MKRKKSFTIIELLIVVVIVGIFFSLIITAGGSYIKDMQFRNNKETFLSNFNSLASQSMSSSYYNGQKFDKLNFSMGDQKKFFNKKAVNAGSSIDLGKEKLDVSKFSGFVYSGYRNITFNTGNILFKSYKIGCFLSGSSNIFTTGNLLFELNSTIGAGDYCFKLNLESCRIIEKNCN